MANNCLVTKLKREVENNNLSILNTMFLDYIPNGSNIVYVIRIASEGTLNLTFKQPVGVGSISNKVSSYTVTHNEPHELYFDRSTLGDNIIRELVKIEGDIYKISALSDNNPDSKICNSGIEYKNNWNTLKYNEEIKVLSININDMDKVPTQVKCLFVNTEAGSGSIVVSMPSVIADLVNLEYLYFSKEGSSIPYISLDNNIKNRDSLKYINPRVSGVVTDLPKNIMVLSSASDKLSGSVEALVANMNSRGRTSGILAFNTPDGSWTVTYNVNGEDKTLAQCVNAGVVPNVSNWAYLSWSGNTITWLSAKPSELDNYVPTKKADEIANILGV